MVLLSLVDLQWPGKHTNAVWMLRSVRRTSKEMGRSCSHIAGKKEIESRERENLKFLNFKSQCFFPRKTRPHTLKDIKKINLNCRKTIPTVYLHFCCFVLQLRREGRVTNVSDVVQRGQKVKVKVLSFTGQKISLSLKVWMYGILNEFSISKCVYVLI